MLGSTGHYPRWMVHIRGLECDSLFYGEHNISVQDSSTDADHCSNVKVCCLDRGLSTMNKCLVLVFFFVPKVGWFYTDHALHGLMA